MVLTILALEPNCRTSVNKCVCIYLCQYLLYCRVRCWAFPVTPFDHWTLLVHQFSASYKVKSGYVFSHGCPSAILPMAGKGPVSSQAAFCIQGPSPAPPPPTCSKLFNLDLTVQGLAPTHVQTCSTWTSLYRNPRHIQTCPLWNIDCWKTGWLAFDWKAFLFVCLKLFWWLLAQSSRSSLFSLES